MQATAAGEELRFGNGPLHPEQEPVIGVTRIIDGAVVGQERSSDGTDLDQAMPVDRGASQAGGLKGQDHADVATTDVGQQCLEPRAVLSPLARATLILIHTHRGLRRPA
jgi:hypothetical protein